MKRGPYKKYLDPNCVNPIIPASTKRRRQRQLDQICLDTELQSYCNTVETAKEDNTECDGFTAEEVHRLLLSSIEDEPPNEDLTSLVSTGELSNITEDQEGKPLRHQEFAYSDESDNESLDLDNSDQDCNNDSEVEIDDFGTTNKTCPTIEEDGGQSPFLNLRSFLDKNSKNIIKCIDINPAEILIMVLTLSLVHNLSLMAVCDVLKLVNVICCTSIFPSSQDLYKKYFNPNFGMLIHYVCNSCTHYLGKQGDCDISICKNCKTHNDLNGQDYAFVTLDIKSQVLEILNNKNCKFKFNSPGENGVYSDINCGSMYKNTVPKSDSETLQYITFTFNTDTSPISKQSKTTITPIYLTINELDLESRKKHMILAGLWYGKEKPRMNVFLQPFASTMKDLRQNGIRCKVNNTFKTYKFICLCCCVDSVARAPIQGINEVNNYHCCSWCEIEGECIDDTIRYPFVYPKATARTESTFKDCYLRYADGADTYTCKGIVNVSPMINIPSFRKVWGFTPDYVHCVLLGVVKRMLCLWTSSVGKKYYIGTPATIKAIDDIMVKIKVPKCLKSKPIKLVKQRLMTGRELENWLLYYSIPLLKGVLNNIYLQHWTLLVCAISIILQDEINDEDISKAGTLLLEFVFNIKDLYGNFEMTYNMHQLLHLDESVRRYGPLWTHTTFPFESVRGNYKNILKSTKGVPHQIVRNLEVARSLDFIIQNYGCNDKVTSICKIIKNMKKNVHSVSSCSDRFLTKLGTYQNNHNIQGLPTDIDYIEYDQAYTKSGVLIERENKKDIQTDNSYIELKNGIFSRVKNILVPPDLQNEPYVILKQIFCDDEPGLMSMKKIKGTGKKFAVNLNEIKNVAIKISVDRENEYICSIPTKHYVLNS